MRAASALCMKLAGVLLFVN